MGTRSSATSSFAISCASDASGGSSGALPPEWMELRPFGGRTGPPARGTYAIARPRLEGDEPEPRGLGDCLEPRVGAELPEHGLHVRPERRGRDAEGLGRGGRARAARQKPEHLELSGRERLDDLP